MLVDDIMRTNEINVLKTEVKLPRPLKLIYFNLTEGCKSANKSDLVYITCSNMGSAFCSFHLTVRTRLFLCHYRKCQYFLTKKREFFSTRTLLRSQMFQLFAYSVAAVNKEIFQNVTHFTW